MTITIDTARKRQVIDITDMVNAELPTAGVLHVFVKHTTAAVTVADLDPGTDADILDAIALMTPDKRWRHPHDPMHFPDHLWSALVGPSLSVPFQQGKMQLGNWQRLILLEFDGPRQREIILTILK